MTDAGDDPAPVPDPDAPPGPVARAVGFVIAVLGIVLVAITPNPPMTAQHWIQIVGGAALSASIVAYAGWWEIRDLSLPDFLGWLARRRVSVGVGVVLTAVLAVGVPPGWELVRGGTSGSSGARRPRSCAWWRTRRPSPRPTSWRGRTSGGRPPRTTTAPPSTSMCTRARATRSANGRGRLTGGRTSPARWGRSGRAPTCGWPRRATSSPVSTSDRKPRPRAAQALIEFLTGERSQQILFERGGLPATRAVVYSDQAVRERYPYVAILEEALTTAELRPTQPHYARLSEVFRAAVTGYLRQERPLADDLQAQLEHAVEGRLTPAGDG